MQKYSDEQLQLIHAIEGPVLCVACPGSGKTTSMIGRIKYMLDNGIDGENMLVTTFTDAAAKEMKSRLNKICSNNVEISTIHSFCYSVIKGHGDNFSGLINTITFVKYFVKQKTISTKSPFFNPIERKRVYREYSYDQKWVNLQSKMRNDEILYNALILEMSYYRINDFKAEDYMPRNTDFNDCVYCILDILKAYEHFKQRYKLIDFDDMLAITKDIFLHDEETLHMWQEKYKYIMIDEFQDTNSIQADIFYMLQTGNICVVGDDDQSIYGFRHADSSIMLSFPEHFKDCRIIKLSTNYRSKQNIIEKASALIKNNEYRFDKDFKHSREEIGDIQFFKYEDETKQAEAIMQKIETAVAAGMSYTDFGIIYRNNIAATAYVGLFTKNKIPYYCTGAIVNFHDGEIFNDIKLYYQISRKDYSAPNLANVFWRPSRYLKVNLFRSADFNKQSHLKCCTESWQKDKVTEMWKDIEDLSKIDEPESFLKRMRNMKAGQKRQNYFDWLKDSYREKHGSDADCSLIELEWNTILTEAKSFSTMEDWMYYAENYADTLKRNNKENRDKGVCLTTMHSAKGLEWNTVFLINAVEGTTPSRQAESEQDYEEERRLFYVAATRAKDNLYVSVPTTKLEKISRYVKEFGLIKKPKAVVKRKVKVITEEKE